MHEISIAEAMLAIIRDEMKRHRASRLLSARISCGVLSRVAPEALDLGFTVLTKGTDLEGARLDIVREDLLLACGRCRTKFSPDPGPLARVVPCPCCAQETGHRVIRGEALSIEHLEVE